MDADDALKFIQHPAINQSWIAEQLWGGREGKFRTRISKIISGIRSIQPDEVVKLQQIKEQLKNEL